jgi:hypothetical protein
MVKPQKPHTHTSHRSHRSHKARLENQKKHTKSRKKKPSNKMRLDDYRTQKPQTEPMMNTGMDLEWTVCSSGSTRPGIWKIHMAQQVHPSPGHTCKRESPCALGIRCLLNLKGWDFLSIWATARAIHGSVRCVLEQLHSYPLQSSTWSLFGPRAPSRLWWLHFLSWVTNLGPKLKISGFQGPLQRPSAPEKMGKQGL